MRKLLILVATALLLPFVHAEELGAETEITLLTDMGVIIVAATILAFVAAGLKQPLIPAYIIAGVMIGPLGTQMLFGETLISDPVFVRALSELGITFLLFTVGIELELSRLKDVGRAALLIGSAQVAMTFILGFGAAVLLGFGSVESIYLGLILAFSSTMVVIKILSDRDEIETLHGRIMLGILLMQDIVVVIVLSLLGSTSTGIDAGVIADSLLKAAGLFSLAIVISRYIAPKILHLVSKSAELVFLTSLAFALTFALSSHILGFSTAIGGFLGGMSLAVFPYNLEVANRIKPLRDFFAIMFFVSLGMQFSPIKDLGALILPVIVFSVLVLVLKPIIISFLAIMTGYEKRTSFLSGAGLGQVSEFGLILAIGLLATNPDTIVFPMTLILGILTISLTPYLIRYGNSLYVPFSGILSRLEMISPTKNKIELENLKKKELKNHVVVFGAHIIGMEVIEKLQEMDKPFVVVDHNPEIIKKLIRKNVPAIYGDLEDTEILQRVNLEGAKLVISTVPDEEDSLFVIKKTKEANSKAIVFVTAKTLSHAIRFYREGADFIIHLKLLGGKEASERLMDALEGGQKSVIKKKIKEIEYLEKKRRDEIIDRVDKQFIEHLDELRAQECLNKSETLEEE